MLLAYQAFRVATLINIPVSLMYYVGPMLVLLISTSLVWVIAALVAARLLQAMICGGLALRLVPKLRRWPQLQWRPLQALLQIGAWVTISNTLWPVMLHLDRFIVGAVFALAAVSYYATPLDLVMRLMMVPMGVTATMFPAVAMGHRTMPNRSRALLRTGVLVTVVVVFPPCLLMAELPSELLSLWLAEGFAAESWTVLAILEGGMYLNCVAVLPGALADAIGRPDIGAVIMLGFVEVQGSRLRSRMV